MAIEATRVIDRGGIMKETCRILVIILALEGHQATCGTPAITNSSYIGGVSTDTASRLALGRDEACWISLATSSTNLPTTNAIQCTYSGDVDWGTGTSFPQDDIYVARFSADGGLTFATYLGTNRTDVAYDMICDPTGNVYVVGETGSTNFPFDIVASSTNDPPAASSGFLLVFDNSGSNILYSTRLIGTRVTTIALDHTGSVYVAGMTEETNSVTDGAYCSSTLDQDNVFVMKFKPMSTEIVYRALIGGNDIDDVVAMQVDGRGDVYLTGQTRSTNFPVVGGIQSVLRGGGDGYVAVLDSGGSNLVLSTYLGGDGGDCGTAIALDASSNIYVCGSTSSTNFPTEHSVLGTAQGGTDGFVAMISPCGTNIVFSTYFGGTGDDDCCTVSIDGDRRVWFGGGTTSADMPVTNAFQSASLGNGDGFVAALSPEGTNLVFSSYLGGSGSDVVLMGRMGETGTLYVVGTTSSTNFPVHNARQSTLGGLTDAFLTIISDR